MTHRRTATHSHVRPMAGWWLRSPRFSRYMLREASAIFLVVYALLLLAGLLQLARGPDAFAGWRAAMGSPLAVFWHVLSLAMVTYHSLTWFQVMPKTLPRLPVKPVWVTVSGLVLTVVLSASLLAGVRWAVLP